MSFAIISNDGMYRYWLERILADSGITVCFVGVNPSTADAIVPDQTDMKWRGFGRLMGAERYIAGNPFAFRATDVGELSRATDPIGPHNDDHLRDMFARADVIVPCWGSRSKLPKTLWPRLAVVTEMILASGKPVRIFGLTKTGDPKHPLMLGYDTKLTLWNLE